MPRSNTLGKSRAHLIPRLRRCGHASGVVHTELGVAQAIRVDPLVLQPQQLQRDVLVALALALDLQPIRFGTSWLEFSFAAFEQPLVQCKAIQLVWQRPAQASAVGTFDVALNGGRADI
jgi:hypothetical protein